MRKMRRPPRILSLACKNSRKTTVRGRVELATEDTLRLLDLRLEILTGRTRTMRTTNSD
jgi:hypothetical protein